MPSDLSYILDTEISVGPNKIDVKLLENTANKLVSHDYHSLVARLSFALAVPLQVVVSRYIDVIQRLRYGKAILPSFVPEYQHLKTGNSYCVIIEKDVMIESTWRPGVLYMNEEGVLIVRDKEEFYDANRFEKITQESANQ